MGKGNLIGEPINGEILKQIDRRQKMHGAGYNSESVKRDPQVLNYLNNRNAWIKMASGVSIDGEAGKERLKDIFAQSPDQSYTTDFNNLTGTGLAKNLILFNTIQSINDYDPKKQQPYISRSGVRRDNILDNSIDKMYGGLGGNSQGLQPIGGITDFTVESLNRGSIRKATVNVKVYNKFQFNLIELLYLRLGYIMILEWGWDKYVKDIVNVNDSLNTPPTVTLENMGPTIIETDWFDNNTHTQQSMLKLLHKKRIETQGNYDAFFGKVSNFSWKVNKDGSYDIKIDLITLGSVIESINVRKPAIDIPSSSIPIIQEQLADKFDIEVNTKGQYDNSLISNIGNNVISQWLGQTILNFPPTNDYFNLNISAENYHFPIPIKVPQTQRYYIRLGHFLNNLQNKIFNNIENGGGEQFKQVKIDTGVLTNKCNYILNLIPLDPRVCIFDFQFSKDFSEKSKFKSKYNFTQNISPGSHGNGNDALSSLGVQPFVVRKEGNIIYGQLMNLYMNIDFLQKELDSNLNDKGELSLFQYLESICKGINRCTGNITNLEPAIKDDNSIYFLEQNPIKGSDSKIVKKDTAPIEILGYNSKGESNFVKDFSFNTKITPDLMNMISIGATSEGNAASIPFNNWNEGLDNRFELKSSEPVIDPNEQRFEGKNKIEGKGFTNWKEIIKLFQQDMATKGSSSRIDQDGFVSLGTLNYDWEWKNKNIYDLGWGNPTLTGNWETDINNESLLQDVIDRVQELEKKYITKNPKLKLVDSSLITETNILKGVNIAPGDEYLSYILSAFGGKTGLASLNSFNSYKEIDIDKSLSLWYKSVTNIDFINRGISSFKKYTNSINVAEYKNSNIQSSTSGFIPVELGLTLEGLSGVKIYNKIEINQKFLPPAYPKALKFVIRGINHSVKNNIWETNLKTISTSITDQSPNKESTNFNRKDSDENLAFTLGPIPPKNPNEKIKILDNRTTLGTPFDPRTYQTIQGIDWLIGELNIHTQETWRKFFNILNEKYPGYTFIINATYRSYQRSKELQIQNPKNAKPGYSPHNYAYALDMNVKDPNGKVYKKKDRKSWVESGIPKIAESLGLRWGGNFKGYIDCVHFDITPVTDASIANAKKDNKGLPQSQWNTKDTNYV